MIKGSLSYKAKQAVASFSVVASIVGLALPLTGCDSPSKEAITLPTQRWQDVDVQIESRPSPPVNGINEIWVLITDANGNPAWDCLVYIRSSSQDPWKQAIQDGRVAVYRRAILLDQNQHEILQVEIKRNGKEAELSFPLKIKP
jgi:hypothetical protein